MPFTKKLGCTHLAELGAMLPSIHFHHVALITFILVALLIFHFRNKIAAAHDRYRTRRRFDYSSLRGFQADIESGLSSNTFDITANVDDHDERQGLSEDAKREIAAIMEKEGKDFDHARLEYTRKQFQKNSVNKDGLPQDPKLVTF